MHLADWIRLVIAERGRPDRPPSASIEDGIRESLVCGNTSIADITTTETLGPFTSQADFTFFAEIIGFSLSRAESALAALNSRLQSLQTANVGSGRASFAPQLGISPHAPYTVSLQLLQRLVQLASERSLPVAMHLAESREELAFLASGSGPFQDLLEERSMWDSNAVPQGSRPLDYLRMLAGAPRALVIHGNYLDFHELSFLGANRNHMSLVYCPRTHAYFAHEPYPLVAALAARVRVALGTDSRASNPDLNLLAEMRHLLRHNQWLGPQDVLRMGTLVGAKGLGRDKDVGSIAEGKLANLVAIPIDDHEHAKPNEILAAIFAAESAPSAIYLAGRPLNP
jgi:cytosine/adenosine deaminase-related metal-dependent hydrolase